MSVFTFDKLIFLFVINFYRDLFFFNLNFFFDVRNFKSRLIIMKLNFYSYKNFFNNLNSFLSGFYRAKSMKRYFNIFNFYNKEILMDGKIYSNDFEIKSFSVFDRKVIFSLFLRYNLDFFRRFLEFVISERFYSLYGLKYYLDLNGYLVKYFLDCFLFNKAIFFDGDYVKINLLIVDRIVYNYIRINFFDFNINEVFFFNGFLSNVDRCIISFKIFSYDNWNSLKDSFNRFLFNEVFKFYNVYNMYGKYFDFVLDAFRLRN